MTRKIAAGNWKMNGLRADLDQLQHLASRHATATCDILICPPVTLLATAAQTTQNTPIRIGAQDCHAQSNGAHTGDISAQMLADAGASAVILGHSERRTDHGETDQMVADKASAAQAAGLMPIICVGETLDQRESGDTLSVIGTQLLNSIPDSLTNFVIAYEPVWAIGTGLTPTAEQIAEVHAFMRQQLAVRFDGDLAINTPLLYGGSVKGSNAAAIFGIAHVDGALVGGASLTCEDFSPIIQALEATV